MLAEDETTEGNPILGHERYRLINYVSRGSRPLVVLARDALDGEKVAMKLIPRTKEINERANREIEHHKLLHHPHVIPFKDHFMTEQYFAIVTEYANGGDLDAYICRHSRLSDEQARWIFQQLVFGLDYVHRKGLCNRDIKPANVLLDDAPKPMVKICDFGYCKHDVRDDPPKTKLGTIPYMAPEVFFTDERNGMTYDGKKADIWSCGAVLFKMITGRKFFKHDANTTAQYQEKISERLERLNTLPFSDEISEHTKSLVRMIMKMDPNDRPSINEIQNHPWYQQDLPPGTLLYNDQTQRQ